MPCQVLIRVWGSAPKFRLRKRALGRNRRGTQPQQAISIGGATFRHCNAITSGRWARMSVCHVVVAFAKNTNTMNLLIYRWNKRVGRKAPSAIWKSDGRVCSHREPYSADGITLASASVYELAVGRGGAWVGGMKTRKEIRGPDERRE